MELKMQEVSFPKSLEFNFEEIKTEVAESVKKYANMVYTDDNMKDAKADRAKLNKFVTALEDKRKEVKKQCLEPYEEFEKKIKEIVAIVDEPIQLIDSQVKEYEEQKKAAKLEEIKAYWETIWHPEWLKCDQIFDQKWLNASVSMTKVKEKIEIKLIEIDTAIKTINSLQEFSFEAMEDYKQNLDLSHAIAEGQRLADIQKRKAEQEAAQKAKNDDISEEEQISGQLSLDEVKNPEKPDTVEGNTIEVPKWVPEEHVLEMKKQWIKFQALLSVEEAKALKEFFETRNIEFKAI